MTPTQAQIDAALKAFRLVRIYDEEEHLDGGSLSDAMKAALTAAAEVNDMAASMGKDHPLYGHVTAAAEVDNRSASELADVLTVMERNERNATIERCAQVAEKAGMGEDVSVARASIAAAIRALKDQP